ncbi:acyl-CoA dehydrogenase family protein [Mesorhizobium sp. LHD-90]|uniref:acyl-CoA dehydrogenase family protein n=1 Tax=Mesorhizobium sp. LHD-90 TaxID=3071414 RepID=UPI0027E1BF2C|nr:acyl-CoA dehydrogenase family protein [Mesorhizobium sp. LHD-90]MDQ6433209.1 acyl-CoA dehydrogenase family protein [Mesorhizobium sp. LHD-90]
MEFRLSPEQREMVATVRAVTQERIKPRALKFLDGTFPWENLKDLAEIGITGMAIPEEYGGLGLSVLDTALVVEEVAKGCYTTAMALMPQLGVQTRILAQYAPEELKRRIFDGVIRGEYVLAVCMTEPHAGTDVANIKTNTEIKGDRAVINGTKTLISKVDEAQLFVVFTRVDKIAGREGIGCVLVDRDTPGMIRTGRFHTMGGEHLFELTFENVEVPLENLVIKGDGLKKLMSAFNTQRCLNPSISLGLAEGAFEEAVKYCRDRTAFNRPIGKFQGMRWKLAEMYRDIEIGRSMLYRAAASANPYPDPHLAALAKMYCNEMAIRVTSEAIQVHGGYGFTDEFPVSRYFRGARYGTLGGGTTETLKELVGKKIINDFPHDGFLGMGNF